jgi:hypothetical protein
VLWCECNPRSFDILLRDLLLFPTWQLVFARTTPAQKLMIAEHVQKVSLAPVAMTGDGVNDGEMKGRGGGVMVMMTKAKDEKRRMER